MATPGAFPLEREQDRPLVSFVQITKGVFMQHSQIFSLEGKDTKNLPKFIVHFTDDTNLFVDSLKEAIAKADENKLSIRCFEPAKIDDSLFTTAENWIDEIKALLNNMHYAIYGQENFNHGYEKKFFTFFEFIKLLEIKVREIKIAYQTNFEIINAAERKFNITNKVD